MKVWNWILPMEKLDPSDDYCLWMGEEAKVYTLAWSYCYLIRGFARGIFWWVNASMMAIAYANHLIHSPQFHNCLAILWSYYIDLLWFDFVTYHFDTSPTILNYPTQSSTKNKMIYCKQKTSDVDNSRMPMHHVYMVASSVFRFLWGRYPCSPICFN